MDLTVDFDSRRVTYREQEIKLTVKEFQLSTILIKNKGQVVTKELIPSIKYGTRAALLWKNIRLT